MTGTLVNAAAILAGGTAGLALRERVPGRLRGAVVQALGLCTLVVGMKTALEIRSPVVVILSLAAGAAAGEAMRLQERLESGAGKLKAAFRSRSSLFVDGFVASSLTFCVGPMAMVGALKEGMTGNPDLLLMKSALDGVSAAAFAAAMGPGVLCSALTALALQGGLTLFAGGLGGVLTEPVVNEINASGGAVIFALGLSLLDVKKIPLANLIPALPLAGLLAYGAAALGWGA